MDVFLTFLLELGNKKFPIKIPEGNNHPSCEKKLTEKFNVLIFFVFGIICFTCPLISLTFTQLKNFNFKPGVVVSACSSSYWGGSS
jgi:hypothetical protein